jgi:hypothetical protein
MKKFYFLLLVLFLFSGMNAQVINFPDANFKAKLLEASTSNQIATTFNHDYIKIDANDDGEIGLSEAANVFSLNIVNNNISDLTGIEYFTSLWGLSCTNTLITTLNLGGNNIYDVYLQNNPNLAWINLKNNIISSDPPCCPPPPQWGQVYFGENPNLRYICIDEQEFDFIQNKINEYGYTNCHVNSYCSFVPGGAFYTIQGNNRLDSDNNGCNASDIPASNLKFSITDGTVSGSMIANTTGAYSIPVGAGMHTITPVLENPTYFNVSPTTVNVTFPTQTSPFTQDFCVTANGVHPDLEITLLPLQAARPGFDATYKIIYKNKGNTTQSGSVNLAFNDAVLDYVSANPAITNQTLNNLSWDYINLAPFETKEITLTLNVNAPTETPAVNNGDVLAFTATITSPATEETPTDNTLAFNQTVVNSFDPNDKTCLEGTVISPSMIGKYVHYMIRFENTGTFPAQNIVVKDMIDTTKFDISTLVPVKGSHSFVTKITEGNKVEFIFENINLPFDNANNDGFVAFKIKTKPTLVLGDSFSNTANIYFDYNFPIVTDPATTTIQTLGTQDFEFSNYFTVYPNPASTTLNLSVKNGIEVSSINIYNTLGQLVLAIPNAQTVSAIDVSRLTAGNYFIKMNTDKGTSNTKFIKN